MITDEEVSDAVAQLRQCRTDKATEEVLRAFVAKATVTIEEKRVCSGCSEENALCFRCKAQEVLGEQATMALPILLPKLALMVKGWASEAWEARRRARAAQAAQDHATAQQARSSAPPPPPPAGRQVF